MAALPQLKSASHCGSNDIGQISGALKMKERKTETPADRPVGFNSKQAEARDFSAGDTGWWRNLILAAGMIAVAGGLLILRQSLVDADIGANRAWVVPIGASYTAPTEKGAPFALAIKLANAGHSPATDHIIYYAIHAIRPWSVRGPGLMKYLAAHNVCEGARASKDHEVIYTSPAADATETVVLQRAADQQVYKPFIEAGGWGLLLQACSAYRTFGAEHHTSICYFYIPGVTSASELTRCIGGQHAD